MYVEGFRTALPSVVNKHARDRHLLKEKDANLAGEDIREGLAAIIPVKLREYQFEGQSKAKLGNVSMRSFVQKTTYERNGRVARQEPDIGCQEGPRRCAGSGGGEERQKRDPP